MGLRVGKCWTIAHCLKYVEIPMVLLGLCFPHICLLKQMSVRFALSAHSYQFHRFLTSIVQHFPKPNQNKHNNNNNNNLHSTITTTTTTTSSTHTHTHLYAGLLTSVFRPEMSKTIGINPHYKTLTDPNKDLQGRNTYGFAYFGTNLRAQREALFGACSAALGKL